MTPDNKRKAVIGLSLLVIFGAAAYAYSRGRKPEEASGELLPPKEDGGADSLVIQSPDKPVVTPGGTGSGGYSSGTKPTLTTSQVLSFQRYANGKGEHLAEDGKWGPKTQAAWNKWGSDWLKTIASQSTSTSPIGKKVYAKLEDTYIFDQPRVSIVPSDFTPIGKMHEGTTVGTIKGSSKDRYSGKTWYEVSLNTFGMVAAYGYLNSSAKTGWVLADSVNVK